MQTTALVLPALFIAIASLMGGELVAAPAPAPPDLTKGERDLTEKRTYRTKIALTGARAPGALECE